ncbi:MAG: DNA-binding protein [Rickettsiaceae bacterium]|jgi:hypothetical protein|nr:DNA-binding protein [Rickettsiaceae bacterium]
MQDLTSSNIDRQNILNNPYALQKMQENLDLGGIVWDGGPVFTKTQVAHIFSVDEKTIERYLSSHGDELKKNGYQLLKAKKLLEFKGLFAATDIDVGSKITQLGIFTFRTVLNIAMLLTESEMAKEIRLRMLDIVIDVIAERSGGHTKYINQRSEEYLFSDFQQKKYRKGYVSTLTNFVEPFQYKYQTYTDKVYQAIFKERASEYRRILRLDKKENVRETMYSEVLEIIASIENGLAYEIKKKYEELERKLTSEELKKVFESFVNHPSYEPLIQKARTKMASRDLCFRDALHLQLEEYVQSVPKEDFKNFLGEKSKELEERIIEAKEVFKRLKDR